MAQYQQSMIVQKQSARQRAALTVPEKQKQSALEFAAALQKYAPRVAGQRPDRMAYIRTDGSTTFEDSATARGASRALYLIFKAEGLPIFTEVQPVPNPKGGSPLYQILGYLTGSRDRDRKVAFEAL